MNQSFGLLQTKMDVKISQKSLDSIVDGFTGREDMEGYDAAKPYKLYELNRDFVWDDTMQVNFIQTILTGYPIPAITMCNSAIIDGGNRVTTLWRFRNNKFKVLLNGVEYDYDSMCKTREVVRAWDRCQIPLVEITNATFHQISQIYENLNKGIRLTTGQLLENRKYRPIVDAALSIIGKSTDNSQFPYRDMVNRVWNSRIRNTKSRTEISFAFQLLMGTMYGPNHFHNSFTKYVPFITDDEQKANFENLRFILKMIDEVDPENKIPRKKKSECFRRLVGAIIYDLFTMEKEEMRHKWQIMFDQAYNVLPPEQFKAIFDVGSARAQSETKLQAISQNVQKIVNGERLNVRGFHDETTCDSESED